MNLFGSALTITDNFSTTFSKFTNSLNNVGNGFTNFTTKIGEAERANRKSMNDMEKEIKDLAKEYEKQGYSISQALKKATSEVSKTSLPVNNWINAFGKIKQSGTDAFEGIGNKMQNFSNSTLGTVTKLTAGFLTLKSAIDGLKEGFKTGMEYQNLRIVMNSVYGSEEKGGQKFNMATDFANKTIWQESDVVNSLARLKALGIDDSKEKLTMMSDVGSFAKAAGVGDIKSATEAYSDMLVGDWFRMTNILGIKRQQMEDFAKENNMKSFSNKQGQIVDREALENVFSAYIKKQGISGLTEKMGDTATGKISTFMDNFKKSLANLVGITNEGTVKSGSLFDKFTQGLQKFTTKIQEFSESENFNKFSSMLSDLGNSIYNGFSFMLDHPELISNLLKFGVALFAIGKIGSFVSAISSFATLFGAGGLLSGLGAVLVPILPGLAVIIGGFLALKSLLSPDGILNKGIGQLLGTLFGTDIQKGWEENTNAMAEFFRQAKEGWKLILGLSSTEDINKQPTEINSSKWYGGADGKTLVTDTSNIKFKTASDMMSSGELVKTNTNKTVTTKNDININIDKVEKTADVDEFMDTVVKRMDKYSSIRNNLE